MSKMVYRNVTEYNNTVPYRSEVGSIPDCCQKLTTQTGHYLCSEPCGRHTVAVVENVDPLTIDPVLDVEIWEFQSADHVPRQWWYAVVKDHSSGEVSMRCGRLVVQAPDSKQAREKMNELSKNWTDQYLGLITHGPFNTKEEADNAS